MPFSRGSSQPKERTPVSCHLQWSVGYLPLAAPGKPHIFTKQKFFSALSRKDQVLRQYFYLLGTRSWLRGGRFESVASSGHRNGWGGRDGCSHKLQPRQTATAIRPQRQGWGRRSPLPRSGLWSPAEHSPRFGPWAPSSHAGSRLGEREGPREKDGIRLLPHSPLWPPLHQPLAKSLFLSDAPWQLAACGWGPLQCWPESQHDH